MPRRRSGAGREIFESGASVLSITQHKVCKLFIFNYVLICIMSCRSKKSYIFIL